MLSIFLPSQQPPTADDAYGETARKEHENHIECESIYEQREPVRYLVHLHSSITHRRE